MPFVSKPGRYDSDAIIPGRVTDPYGFVTEHTVIEGLHGPITLYFSVTGLRLLAERYPEVGLVPLPKLADARDEVDRAREQITALTDENAELRAKLDRISGLQRDGFKIARVQGRPKKVEA